MAPVDAPPERVSEAFERLWVCYGTLVIRRASVGGYRASGARENANEMK